MLGNWGEERLISTVYACEAPLVFVGNLENTATLIHVARPYITETQESFISCVCMATFGEVEFS